MSKRKKIIGLIGMISFAVLTTLVGDKMQEEEIRKAVKEEIENQKKGEA